MSASRRQFAMAVACFAAAGAAYVLKPSRHLSLLSNQKKVSDIVPKNFGDWRSRDVGELFAVDGPDSLSAQLYRQTVGRIYVNSVSDSQILAFLAYGDLQSNALQLHRPEVCYPAFGYTITESQAAKIPLAPAADVPARLLEAESGFEKVSILYWTRMGENFPDSGSKQRFDRIEDALRGVVPDGLLARFSTPASTINSAKRSLENFAAALIRATAPSDLAALVGTSRAELLATSHATREMG